MPGGQGGIGGGEGGKGGGCGGGEGGSSLMRSPYRERGLAFWREASFENQILRNQVFRDQNETGRVAHVHKVVVGHGSQVVAVQKLRGLLHQAQR